MEQKKQLRHSIAERLSHLNKQERETESRSVCRRILQELPMTPITICGFYPMPTEVNILPALNELMKRGCTIALPKTEGRAFTFRIVDSLEKLDTGPFGIREPFADAPELDLTSIDIVLVPGVAFDETGKRLGRGNGGYDQWLEKVRAMNPKMKAWGISFGCQIVREVPTEPHDAMLDDVITARGSAIEN